MDVDVLSSPPNSVVQAEKYGPQLPPFTLHTSFLMISYVHIYIHTAPRKSSASPEAG